MCERADTAELRQPIDPEAGDPAAERPGRRGQARILAVIAAGGAAGALARYGLSAAFPAVAGGADWATLGINAAGCAVIGVLMAILSGIRSAHPLIRPFAVTGVLGGFTTFSAFALDAAVMWQRHDTVQALTYVALSVLGSIIALFAGLAAARAMIS